MERRGTDEGWDRMREAERERLALVMGWVRRPLQGSDELFWVAPDNERAGGFLPFNPFVNWEDWGALAEWVTKQEWCYGIGLYGEKVRIWLWKNETDRESIDWFSPLQEALPLAVLAALEEMKAG